MNGILKIRADQMAAFEGAVRSQIALEILDYLRLKVPDSIAGLDEAETTRRSEFAVNRAFAFGLTGDFYDTIVIWSRLMFTVGPYFDLHPACEAILDEISAPPEMRVESLIHTRNQIPWEEVTEFCAKQEWN